MRWSSSKERKLMEKIYVAIGSDLQEGFKTLEWVLQKWSLTNNPLIGGIALVHVSRDISKEFVSSPFGKLPASSVNEEVMKFLKKQEQDKIDSLLHKYMAFCGEVKVEVVKIEKNDKPVYELLGDLISGHHITKLILDLTFIKSSSSSSRKSRDAVRGLLHIQQHKPEFCELHIVHGGKLVHLREEDAEGVIEDDQGMITTVKTRDKRSFIGRLGMIMFPGSNRDPPPTNTVTDPTNRWEDHVQEIENYFQKLMSFQSDEGSDCDGDTGSGQSNQTDSAPRVQDDPNDNMSASDKIEAFKRRMVEAQQTIERKKIEAKAHLESRLKAERAIHICNQRIEDLETRIEEERTTQVSLQKDLEVETGQLQEALAETEDSKRRLKLLAEVQSDLSSKLQMSMLSKVQAEARLEKVMLMRTEVLREIEELRRQRDVLRRRIEFCRERSTIGMVPVSSKARCEYREYTAEDIRLATNDFSERQRINSASHRMNIYRGSVEYVTTVVIKMNHSSCGLSSEAFERKVKLLSEIRHPHVVAMIGFCLELKCVIFEYMHNGSLQEILFSLNKRSWDFMWHDRVRVAHEISLALGFLQSAKPRPIIHGNLTPSNILLDCNLTAKLGNLGLLEDNGEQDVNSDVRAFGHVMLLLLTGSSSAGLFDKAGKINMGVLSEVLDKRAGLWPWDLVEGFGKVAMRCLSVGENEPGDSGIDATIEELGRMRRDAEATLAVPRDREKICNIHRSDDLKDAPRSFLCPLSRGIMKNPHVAADGFSYELEAIEDWLWTGHETSPMTDSRLDHKFLTPNHSLRTLIIDWQSQQSRYKPPGR